MSSWSIVVFKNLKPNTSIDVLQLCMTMSVKLMYNYDNLFSFIFMYHMKEFLSIDSLSKLIWNPSEGRSMMLSPVLDMLYSQNTLHCSCFVLRHLLNFVSMAGNQSCNTDRTQTNRHQVPKHIEKTWENDPRNSLFTWSKKIYISIYNIFASSTQEGNFPFQR